MNKIYNFLTAPVTVICSLVISFLLTFFTGGLGTLFGILVVLLILISGKWDWKEFGLVTRLSLRTIIRALVIACIIYILIDVLLQPVIEKAFGVLDLSALDAIRGNFTNYIITVIIMWPLAAFGEEFVYRGFFMKWLAEMFGNTNKSWWISAILISALFGFAHWYQGISGILLTGFIGFIFAIIFLRNKTNLWLLIFIHGLYDMIGLTLIYLDKERVLTDWMVTFLS